MCHEQGGRLRLALDKLAEPLPDQVKQVIDATYTSKLDTSKSLEESNEEYLARHKDSAPHTQSVVRFRHVLKPDDPETKAQGVRELQDTLKLETLSLQDAEAGVRVLDDIRADADAKEAYLKAARERWPEATVFR